MIIGFVWQLVEHLVRYIVFDVWHWVINLSLIDRGCIRWISFWWFGRSLFSWGTWTKPWKWFFHVYGLDCLVIEIHKWLYMFTYGHAWPFTCPYMFMYAHTYYPHLQLINAVPPQTSFNRGQIVNPQELEGLGVLRRWYFINRGPAYSDAVAAQPAPRPMIKNNLHLTLIKPSPLFWHPNHLH